MLILNGDHLNDEIYSAFLKNGPINKRRLLRESFFDSVIWTKKSKAFKLCLQGEYEKVLQ